MKVLFYFYKNVHIPLFEPIMREILAARPGWSIYKTSPAYNTKNRYGLDEDDMEVARSLPGIWITHPDDIVADIAVVADSVAVIVRKHRCVVNIGHGLISKGQYYCKNPLINRENHADLMCVPGPWHKEELDKLLDIHVEVTGMSKLDMLFSPFDKETFCRDIGVDPFRPIVLWAPTFNMELSGIPVIWTRIREVAKIAQVLIKVHSSTPDALVDPLKKIALEMEDIFFVERQDGTPFMRIADLMITDVSSVMFEFAALDKPLVLVDNPLMDTYANYRPDDIEYQWREIGPRISDGKKLAQTVLAELGNPDRYSAKRKECTSLMFAATDGRNCTRIVQAMEKQAASTGIHPSCEVVLRPGIQPSDLGMVLDGIDPGTTVHVPWKNSTTTSCKLFTYGSDEELKQHLGESSVEMLLIFEEPAILVKPWKKQLFRPFRRMGAPDLLAPLSTSQKRRTGYMLWHMKVSEKALQAGNSIQDFQEIIMETNVAELNRVPLLESPLFSIKREKYLEHFDSRSDLREPGELCKALATDSLCQEISRA